VREHVIDALTPEQVHQLTDITAAMLHTGSILPAR
jgi:hypothetical protein